MSIRKLIRNARRETRPRKQWPSTASSVAWQILPVLSYDTAQEAVAIDCEGGLRPPNEGLSSRDEIGAEGTPAVRLGEGLPADQDVKDDSGLDRRRSRMVLHPGQVLPSHAAPVRDSGRTTAKDGED